MEIEPTKDVDGSHPLHMGTSVALIYPFLLSLSSFPPVDISFISIDFYRKALSQCVTTLLSSFPAHPRVAWNFYAARMSRFPAGLP